jgi:MATE family multidrug resistance protein
MLGYVSTFVAQYRGAGQHQRVGAVYRHAIWLAWITVPAMLLVMVLAGYIFHWAGHAKTLADLEADYLRYLMIGGLATLFYSVQSGLLTGQGNTGTVLVIDVIATILNLVLTYLLIFGNSWLPEMGVKGAAIATSISFWIKLPLAHWAIHRHPTARQLYALDRSAPLDLKLIGRIINFGAPAGFQMLAESGCFVIIIMQVGNLGELPMAASTLALSLNTMAFVPMLGLGIATSVLVGEHITDGRLHLAKRTATISIATSVLYTSFFVIALGLFAQTTSLIYSWGTEPERFARIQPLLVPLLQIIGLYCVFDGLQIAFVGAIKGAGDTWFVLAATAAISVLVVSSGLLLQSQLGNSLLLWWWVIFGWVVAMAIVFSARYFSGAWESKRVID